MKYTLKYTLLAAILGSLVTAQVQAAQLPTQSEQVTCDSGGTLTALAQTIQSINKLNPSLTFDFNGVETVRRQMKKSEFVYLQCSAQLTLINPDTKQVVDSLRVRYEIKNDGKSGYVISFEPVR
jgi:opacity protein-like surface antigen